MSTYEKKQLEKSFSIFTKKHFERPSRCKTVAQVQFYINELVGKIEELKFKFNYVPSVAYTLLTQYNTAHNSISGFLRSRLMLFLLRLTQKK